MNTGSNRGRATLRLDQDWFAGKVYEALFTGDISPIPLIVHTLAAAANKTAAMLALTKAYPASPGSGEANQMLFYAFRCDEPWSSAPPVTLSGQRGSFAYQSDLETDQWYQYVCPLIPKSAAAVGHEQLTVSTVPVLAFNGAYDPIEQPRNWGRGAAVLPRQPRHHAARPGARHHRYLGRLRGPVDPDVHRAGQPGPPEHRMPGRRRPSALRPGPPLIREVVSPGSGVSSPI